MLGLPQLSDLVVAGIAVDDAPAVDETLGTTRVFSLFDLALAAEICPGHIEAVNMAWNDATQEPQRVDEGVGAYAGH